MSLTNFITNNRAEIISARIKAKLSQKKLAEISGVSLRALQYLETGKQTSLHTISKVRKALNLPL